MNRIVDKELSNMNIEYDYMIEIRSKDGVLVYRVVHGDKSYVLKYFMNDSDRREIENYYILNSLGIMTIQLISSTPHALLMEDVEQSNTYRLGNADDLNDITVAVQIAKWYKELHSKGKSFVSSHKGNLYDETDVITKANIDFIKSKTSTESNPVWKALFHNFDFIKENIAKAERTLTYNDFYYTNLIVGKDKSSAFMFDYNLLGKGYVFSDIRNVCSSLSEHAKAAFLKGYGEFNKKEMIIDSVVSPLTTLYFACKRNTFPLWAEASLSQVKNGQLLNNVNLMMKVENE